MAKQLVSSPRQQVPAEIQQRCRQLAIQHLGEQNFQNFQSKFFSVLERIEQARQESPAAQTPSSEVELLAVSKHQEPAFCLAAMACAQQDFGENRLLEWQEKQAWLAREAPEALAWIRWHWLAPLQQRQVPSLIGKMALIQSIDRFKAMDYVERLAGAQKLTQAVLLQVNLAAEPQKHGFSVQEMPLVLEQIPQYKHLNVRGLMFMAPADLEAKAQQAFFAKAQELYATCQTNPAVHGAWSILSMGMSRDFEAAIHAGSNMLRLGSCLSL